MDGPPENPKTLANYPQIVDRCLITVTPVRRLYLQVPKNRNSKNSEVLICPLVRATSCLCLSVISNIKKGPKN